MHADAREISALVAMPRLLAALGFSLNARVRRCPCILHAGQNPSAFSWREDGRWYCFVCGKGGDRIGLVVAARQCSFREAVGFLAELAGGEFRAHRFSRSEIKQQRAEQTALRNDASLALAALNSSWRETHHALLQLEAIRRKAGRRMNEILEGLPERWCGETDWCWAALAEVAGQMPRAAAAYAIASFGSYRDRMGIALDPSTAKRLIDQALDDGFVTDERGRRSEVIL